MFVHQLTDDECEAVLRQSSIGRLSCARDNQPDVMSGRRAAAIAFGLPAGIVTRNSPHVAGESQHSQRAQIKCV